MGKNKEGTDPKDYSRNDNKKSNKRKIIDRILFEQSKKTTDRLKKQKLYMEASKEKLDMIVSKYKKAEIRTLEEQIKFYDHLFQENEKQNSEIDNTSAGIKEEKLEHILKKIRLYL